MTVSCPIPKAPAPAAPVRPTPQPWAYVLGASVVGLALFASATPSPLYATYRALWGFPTSVLTLVYATYALGVLATLVLAGRLSDEIGRRPVLLAALGGIVASTVLYMLAGSVLWLYLARGLQGVATGLALSAASATLLDTHPDRDPTRAGLLNGVASAGGMGLGLLVSSLLVQALPEPRVLPYALLAAMLLVAAGATWRLRDPVTPRPGPRIRLTPQRPNVPPEIRHAFGLSGLAVLASWSLCGLYLSLGPTLTSSLVRSGSVLLSGAVVAILGGAAAAAMVLCRRVAPWAGASGGSLALCLGMVLLVTAVATGSGALFVVATVIAGCGFGVAFLGGLRSLSAVIPPHERAGVMSAFYLVAYGALSLPAVAAGLLVAPLGLHPTFEIFGAAVAVLALLVAGEAWRTRPGRAGRLPAAAAR